ncbi:hypothetical protein CBR_g12727 [Chara braunii]|uniref:TORTIFOLIA1/SINE1-2 N-terminal domain-containing protein n=1 Tax=Chara braunii TaxID=69332 RepID=A0A388KSN4_CHABU|nr:hypothetical protein CBR_g12727 [Chara braunii]|eukprot:GBG73008.1 hypothetical protein CBR_g12727 [Chara braunii]
MLHSTPSSHTQLVELKQRVLAALTKLGDRDTQRHAVEELHRMVEGLAPEGVPIFLVCLYDSDGLQKSFSRKESVRLFGTMAIVHGDLLAPHLSKIVINIVRRFKDPDAGVRDMCAEAMGHLAANVSPVGMSAIGPSSGNAAAAPASVGGNGFAPPAQSASAAAAPSPSPSASPPGVSGSTPSTSSAGALAAEAGSATSSSAPASAGSSASAAEAVGSAGGVGSSGAEGGVATCTTPKADHNRAGGLATAAAGTSHSAMGVFFRPLFDALNEQNKNVQAAAALCLSKVVHNMKVPLPGGFVRLCPRISKCLANPNFLAKGPLLNALGNLVESRSRRV